MTGVILGKGESKELAFFKLRNDWRHSGKG